MFVRYDCATTRLTYFWYKNRIAKCAFHLPSLSPTPLEHIVLEVGSVHQGFYVVRHPPANPSKAKTCQTQSRQPACYVLPYGRIYRILRVNFGRKVQVLFTECTAAISTSVPCPPASSNTENNTERRPTYFLGEKKCSLWYQI